MFLKWSKLAKKKKKQTNRSWKKPIRKGHAIQFAFQGES